MVTPNGSRPELDPVKSSQLRDEGIAVVDAHAHETWKWAAYEAVLRTARAHPRFIIDKVWLYMPDDVYTHNKKAMGPVMIEAAKRGWIQSEGNYTPTAQVKSHRSPRTIWLSQIHGQENIFPYNFCPHVDTEYVSMCCGTGDYYGACAGCWNQTGWDLKCIECDKIAYKNVEAPDP